MQHSDMRRLRARRRAVLLRSGFSATLLVAGLTPAVADDGGFHPGNLLVSRSVYDNNNPANIVPGVTQLPPNCIGENCVIAIAGGIYPEVFNNVTVDGTFGVTSKIFLDEMTPQGRWVSSHEVPNSTQSHLKRDDDQMVTSFSSKSELALNLSTDGRFVTFMGYLAPIDALDVSNSNTPFVIDPTNPDPLVNYRVVAKVDQQGNFTFTKSNSYSGDNGRSAIFNGEAGVAYMAGNAGDGSNPQPNGIILGAGAQILTPENKPLNSQKDPGAPDPVGSFSITELGLKADKVGKDTNFRGLSIFNDVIYLTKGSGSNGINTVYFIDTSGPAGLNGNPAACPQGVGVPAPGAKLPTQPLMFSGDLQTQGVFPYNICILSGFNTALAKNDPTDSFPFGIWFANETTVYISDEGDGDNTFSVGDNAYSAAAAETKAGLQKWVFDKSKGQWTLAYVLQAGLDLGKPYTVEDYPTGINMATGLPWSPATDGLRNLTGRVNGDGTVTVWAVTSTVSGGGDQGADPNKLVAITDLVEATAPPPSETFKTVRAARFGEVLRGVAFAPGTGD